MKPLDQAWENQDILCNRIGWNRKGQNEVEKNRTDLGSWKPFHTHLVWNG